jgi:hypothetical protein
MAAPKVIIEYTLKLFNRGQRNKFSRIFQSKVVDQFIQHSRIQVSDVADEFGLFEYVVQKHMWLY